MTDKEIMAQLNERSESALLSLQTKYGRLCTMAAKRILCDDRDVEECFMDACMRVWNAIPPEQPGSLSAYIVRITRNLALDKYAYNNAEKRGTALTEAFEELESSLPCAAASAEQIVEEKEFSEFINTFLLTQSKDARIFFVRRYWYGEKIKEIAEACGASEEKVKTSLFRTRNRLKNAMIREEIEI